MQSLYEYAVWRDMQDQVMRPGGLGLTNELLDYCDITKNARVLDLGCGCGASLNLVQDRFCCGIYGLDISRQLLSHARGRHCENSLIQADFHAIPFANDSFDLILVECVASISGIENVFSDCQRLLKSGGKILVTDLYARKSDGLKEVRNMPKGTCIQGVVLKEDIIDALISVGLNLYHWDDYSHTMKNFPMKTLSTSLQVSVFDLVLAASSINLGYYGLIAEK